MANITGPSFISELDLYTSWTTPPGGYQLGQFFLGSNGTGFRFVQAGGSALVVGNVLQSPAIDTQFNDMAVPAAVASGATGAITITNGTTALSAGNEFEGGSLTVSVTPGLGESYTILGNSTATNGSALNLYLDRPIRTAWTTSTKVTLRKSPFKGVIQSPATTLTGTPVGVAIYAIPASAYGFVQTKGVGAALSDNTSIIAGSMVSVPSGTAGAVTLQVAGLPAVGYAMQAASSGKDIPVFLQID